MDRRTGDALPDHCYPDEHAGLHGERLLLLSIIECAILDLITSAPTVRDGRTPSIRLVKRRAKRLTQLAQYRIDAKVWLLQERDIRGERPFSLDWCCKMLGWSPETVRQRVRVTLGLIADASIPPYLPIRMLLLDEQFDEQEAA